MKHRDIRIHDLVWFDWGGFRCVSPVYAVNNKTVRVVISDGERLLRKDRIIEHDPAPRRGRP